MELSPEHCQWHLSNSNWHMHKHTILKLFVIFLSPSIFASQTAVQVLIKSFTFHIYGSMSSLLGETFTLLRVQPWFTAKLPESVISSVLLGHRATQQILLHLLLKHTLFYLHRKFLLPGFSPTSHAHNCPLGGHRAKHHLPPPPANLPASVQKDTLHTYFPHICSFHQVKTKS